MRMIYRPDIDGLRAIAVAAVVLFHSEILFFDREIFRGGFIGVDIFFVISGYLITGIILNELKDKNNFSFKSFLEKRARRLLPALFFLILISIPFAFYNLSQSYYNEFIDSVYSSISFLSNFYYHYNSDYFDVPYNLKPLLHTWSLSVEIQFYLFFPFLIILFWRNFFLLIILLSLLILINILLVQFGGNLSIYYPFFDKSFSFYNPPIAGTFYWTTSRIWEFLAGALAFVFSQRYNFSKINSIPVVGILLVFFSFYIFSRDLNNPSFYNLIPVVGTSLILLANQKKSFVGNFLSNRIIVFLGLISYSTYLFHFLIFSFYEGLLLDQNTFDTYIRIFLIILSFLLGYLTFKYIEVPFRRKNYELYKFFYHFIFITVFLILIISFFSNQIKKSLDNEILSNYPKINFNTLPLEYHVDKNASFSNTDKNLSFSNLNKKKFLIIGDSHANDFHQILISSPKIQKNREFILLGSDIQIYFESLNQLKELEIFKQAEYIILTSDYTYPEILLLDDVIKSLINEKKKVMLAGHAADFRVIDMPLIDVLNNSKKILNKNQIEKKLYQILDKIKVNENQKIEQIAKNNNIFYIDKLNFACNRSEETCYATYNNSPINHDKTHITIEGAKFFGESDYLIKIFQNLKF